MTSYYISLSRCNECGRIFSNWGFGSGNTLGAERYTDGRVEAPMFDPGQSLLSCPYCGLLMWTRDTRALCTMRDVDYMWLFERDLFGLKEDEKRAVDKSVLSSQLKGVSDDDIDSLLRDKPKTAGTPDMIAAMQEKPWRNREEEKYVLVNAWWKLNRLSSEERTAFSSVSAAICERLPFLLDESRDAELIMKAECFRLSGRMEQAVSLLSSRSVAGEYVEWASFVKKLAERGDSEIRKIPDNS